MLHAEYLQYLIWQQNYNKIIRTFMSSSTPKPINLDFPSKNYKKYQSQSKTNPFLNKLHQDTGYPQDIFSHHTTIHLADQDDAKNYVQQNKKNLKNFFTGRIPPRTQLIKDSFTIDPSKLFEMKKKQFQLKSRTRARLNQKLDPKQRQQNLKGNKIQEIFQLKDKNEDFKRKFLGAESIKFAVPYSSNNHLKGTDSYLRKYNPIVKKVAYHSVFGPQCSATASKAATSRSFRGNQSICRPFTVKARTTQLKIKTKSKSKELERNRLSSLIQNIDRHRQSLDPENKRGMKPYQVPEQQLDNDYSKNQMITWIKDAVQGYKYTSINKMGIKIDNLEDIQKIDNRFYEQMKVHKAKRLMTRELMVKNVIASNSKINFERKCMSNDELNHSRNALSISDHDDSEKYSVSSEQQDEIFSKVIVKRTPKSLLTKFIRHLVDALQQARYFGIQNKTNVYKAFWWNPEPFEKSGSYAFFKTIKKGDLNGVKSFIQADPDFVYQRDHKGRSPLIYASISNQTEIVFYLLTCDVNVNKISFDFKTSLLYGIRNNNVKIVKILLQSGALPWSTRYCNYSKAMERVNNKNIENLMKNARKVRILLEMQPGKKAKIEKWKIWRQKIVETQQYSFIDVNN